MGAVSYSATGKRKTAVARVRILPGTGIIIVNGKQADEYFDRSAHLIQARSPLVETGTEGRYDVVARIHGGGKSGQAGALKHGIARALVEADPNLRSEVKKAGYLSRDARMVERKKAGLKKARKRPQFSKR
ncbi:MAG: 30S ribosomal protein S9 [Thermoleophilia bacterium]